MMPLSPTLIPTADPAGAARPETQRERAALREACREMEGFFLSLLLKEGMKPVLHESPDAPAGQENFINLAVENMAQELAQQGSFGMADMLYDQLSVLL